MSQFENFIRLREKVGYKPYAADRQSVKGSQFAQPLLEFSGACAGW